MKKEDVAGKMYKGMTAYEVGATQGHSKHKVDSMIKRAKRDGKASLNSVRTKTAKNEGNKMMEAPNEQQRS